MKTKYDTSSRDDSFFKDLEKLKKKYPEYLVSVWCPQDYETYNDNLSRGDCVDISQYLFDNHDASVGINWDAVETAMDVLGLKADLC